MSAPRVSRRRAGPVLLPFVRPEPPAVEAGHIVLDGHRYRAVFNVTDPDGNPVWLDIPDGSALWVDLYPVPAAPRIADTP